MRGRLTIGLKHCAFWFSLLFLAPGAFAASGEEDPTSSPIGWAFRFINFAIVAGFLVWVFWKKAPGFFRQRAEEIAIAIEEAGGSRREAESRLREAEAKLAGLQDEVARMRSIAERDARGERERIEASAKSEAAKMERAAEAEIEAAERAARMNLRKLATRMAVHHAEETLRREVTPKMDAVLFETVVEHLAERVN